ncbi:MAG TPA: hypothetical protein LFW21_00895 [Rickettsia endosymbiont of Pyrocoelia pectoralis]|nr:hypothetical protein [Rickettsia endosymbiont of Pyrocoelia pectoralis]
MINEILQRLMVEVEHRLENLLAILANNRYEIERLHNENQILKDNYIKMLEQINIYVNELEEIKKLQK